MKIPNAPFHDVNSQLLVAILTGGDCLAYTSMVVSNTAVISIPAVEKAVYALLVLEADASTSNKDIVVRFIEAPGAVVSATEGMPLGDLGVYEVKGSSNMQHFQVIGIEPGKTHIIRIQYFG